MTHARHPQWEQRLLDLVAAAVARPYAYSHWDCLLMPAAMVRAVTGKDFGRGHRGKYRSAASASRYLRKLGFDSPEAMLDSLFPQKPIGFAQRGDLVLAADGVPGVCMGDFALSVGEGEAGMVRVPRADWIKAWAIGEQHCDPPKPRKRRKAAK